MAIEINNDWYADRRSLIGIAGTNRESQERGGRRPAFFVARAL